jgi:hypothetical protein
MDPPPGVTTSLAVPVTGVGAGREPAPGRRSGLRPLAWAIIVLILIPTAVFAGADALGGHLLLSGDNLVQSYPLRVLVGADLRHGLLPAWDPWIWSGTPLSSGLNAGAFYPTTFLFAVINPHAAWVVGEIFIFSAVGVGTCLLFSDSGMSPLAAFLGAAVFAFGGAIAAQAAVHTDMAEGLASLPWVLLAIRRIALDGRWRWSALLGVAFALTVLSGSPEAMLDIALLGLTFALLRWSVLRDAWRRLLTRGAVGVSLAIGLSAAVWLPALHFIATSQRANAPESFAGAYSFPPAAGVLALIPYLEGGFGLFAQPAYFGQSNLGEVGCYLGILPLIAVVTMWTPQWKEWLPAGEQRCWYGVLLVGLVLAVGAGTPLEHLLYQIPFYGKQRDSGRNIVDVDLAASALFAWWVDGGARPLAARSRRAGPVAFAPLALIGAVAAWFAISPSTLWSILVAFPPPASADGSIADAIGLAAGLAGVGGLIAWGRGRVGHRRWVAAVSAFAVVDLALFACGSSYVFSQAIPAPPAAGPLVALVKANLSSAGRYGVFDPDLFDATQLVLAGEPDVGIVNGLKSFGGYGAIVDGRYSNVTRTHERAYFDSIALRQGYLDPLGAQVVVTLPQEFLVPIDGLPDADGSVLPVEVGPRADPLLPGGNVPLPQLFVAPIYLAGAHSAISVHGRLGWFFGAQLRPSRAVLTLGAPARSQLVRVGLIGASGSIAWQAPERLPSGGLTGPLAVPGRPAVGMVVQLLSGSPLGPTDLAVESAGRTYLVAGTLSRAITPASWIQAGSADDFAVFRARFHPRTAWVQPAMIGSVVHGEPKMVRSTSVVSSAQVLTNSLYFGSARVTASSANSSTIEVRTPRAGLLAWSTAWDPGWRAEVTPAGAASRSVPVERNGLVLAVAVPAGSSEVRFTYEPVGFRDGAALSLATLAVGLAVPLGLLVSRRRRRPAPHAGS